MKRSTQNYYSKCFESNLTNIKNTWKGINSIISMRSSSSIIPTQMIQIIRKGFQIFSIITVVLSAKKPQAKTKQSHKNYTDYLTNENPNSISRSPIDKEEIKLILTSLDISKATGPYSIPTKVLKLLKNDIFDQLADLFLSIKKSQNQTTLIITRVLFYQTLIRFWKSSCTIGCISF